MAKPHTPRVVFCKNQISYSIDKETSSSYAINRKTSVFENEKRRS